MKNLQSFITSIVGLWDMHQHRESFYKRLLTLHNLGTLRRVCSQGYFSSMLYKKEIQWVYDLSKSALNDGDINEHVLSKPETPCDTQNPSFSVESLLLLEGRTITMYRHSLKQAGYDSEGIYILNDHLQMLCDINSSLFRELGNGFHLVQPKTKFAEAM